MQCYTTEILTIDGGVQPLQRLTQPLQEILRRSRRLLYLLGRTPRHTATIRLRQNRRRCHDRGHGRSRSSFHRCSRWGRRPHSCGCGNRSLATRPNCSPCPTNGCRGYSLIICSELKTTDKGIDKAYLRGSLSVSSASRGSHSLLLFLHLLLTSLLLFLNLLHGHGLLRNWLSCSGPNS